MSSLKLVYFNSSPIIPLLITQLAATVAECPVSYGNVQAPEEDRTELRTSVKTLHAYPSRILRWQAGMCEVYWMNLQQLHATVYGSSLLVIS